MERREVDPLTGKIIGAAITVHRHLGPGLLESTYGACLAAELRHLGLGVERQAVVAIDYRDLRLERAYRIDILVEHTVVVELKVAAALAPIHVRQLLTYLRLADLHVGLLFNFDVEALAAGGIRRVFRP